MISGGLFEENVIFASGELEVGARAAVFAGFSHIHLFVACCCIKVCLPHIDFLFLELCILTD